jgi:hypothetical protein
MDCRTTIMLILVEQKSGSRSFLHGAPLALSNYRSVLQQRVYSSPTGWSAMPSQS